MKKSISIITVSFLCVSLTAQEDTSLDRVIKVENEYNPTVEEAQKILFIPKQEQFVTPPFRADFSEEVHLLKNYRDEMSLDRELPVQEKCDNGYARVGAGNIGRVDARLHYRLPLSSADELTFGALWGGWKGDMKTGSSPDEWNSRLYRTGIRAGYCRTFSDILLQARASWGGQAFNYKPSYTSALYLTDKQHDYWGKYGIGIVSTPAIRSGSFRIQTDYSFFSQKRFLEHGSATEGRWQTAGDFTYRFTKQAQVSFAAQADGIFYSGSAKKQADYKDFWSVEFLPAYSYEDDRWTGRAGVHVDLLTDNGKGLQWAPELYFQWNFSKSLTAYAHITGGRSVNGFETMSTLSPYWAAPMQMKPSYTPFDASVGGEFASLNGFKLTLLGGYRQVNDCLLDVYSLDLAKLPNSGIPVTGYAYSMFYQDKVKALYATASASYGYKDRFGASLRFDAIRWNSDSDGDRDLVMQNLPVYDLQVNLHGKIIDPLTVEASYRHILFYDTSVDPAGTTYDLDAKVICRLWKKGGVYLQGSNLLNHDFWNYAGYFTQSIHGLIGLELNF